MPSMSPTFPVLSRSGQRDPLALCLFLSLLVHLLLLLFFPRLPQRVLLAPLPEHLTEVELLPPPPLAPPQVAKAEPPKEKPQPEEKTQPPAQQQLPEQIVTPPDQSNDEPPEKTRLLSDRDSSAKEQTVAAGIPHPVPSQNQNPAKEKAGPQKPPRQLALRTQPAKPS